jgi:uncharacterized protein with HEPN domain
MSRRRPPLLVEAILEAGEKIERYVSGMDHDAFVGDEKTSNSTSCCNESDPARRPGRFFGL